VRFTICRSQVDRERLLLNLKLTPCPHCKNVGALNRHGFLKAFQDQDTRGKSVRAHRVFCSNRGRNQGCGRTFSVWLADKIKRLFLSATQLWQFLRNTAAAGNKRNAFKSLGSDMSDSAPYRIWKRFRNAQAAIRTALCAICTPPECGPQTTENSQTQNQMAASTDSTLAHLTKAFAITNPGATKPDGQNLNQPLSPIAAFQLTLQAFFI
jgi:hypothetical protein